MSFETIEWSLARDHEFLEELTKHSREFVDRVKDIPQCLDSFAAEVSELNLTLQNVIGQLDALSEKRFIEHRVAEARESPEQPEVAPERKPTTENELNEAIQQGLKAFGLIPAEELTDHEDVYRDFVADRPCPCIIGSKEWDDADLLGEDEVVEIHSGENKNISEAMQDLVSSDSSIEEATEATEWFERESSDGVQDKDFPTRDRRNSGTTAESVSSSGEVFVAKAEPQQRARGPFDDSVEDDGDLFGLPSSVLGQPVKLSAPKETVESAKPESGGLTFLDELKKRTDKRSSGAGSAQHEKPESRRASVAATVEAATVVTKSSPTEINNSLNVKLDSLFDDEEIAAPQLELPKAESRRVSNVKPERSAVVKRVSIFDSSDSDSESAQNDLFGTRKLSVNSVPKVYPSKHVSTTLVSDSSEVRRPSAVSVRLEQKPKERVEGGGSAKRSSVDVVKPPVKPDSLSSDSEKVAPVVRKPSVLRPPKNLFDDDSSDDLFSPKGPLQKVPPLAPAASKSTPKTTKQEAVSQEKPPASSGSQDSLLGRREDLASSPRVEPAQSGPRIPEQTTVPVIADRAADSLSNRKQSLKTTNIFDDSSYDDDDLFGAKTALSRRVDDSKKNDSLTQTKDTADQRATAESVGEPSTDGSRPSVIGGDSPVMAENTSNVKKMALKLPAGLLDGLKAKQQQLGIAAKPRTGSSSSKSETNASGSEPEDQKVKPAPSEEEKVVKRTPVVPSTDVVKIAKNRVRGPTGRRLPTRSKAAENPQARNGLTSPLSEGISSPDGSSRTEKSVKTFETIADSALPTPGSDTASLNSGLPNSELATPAEELPTLDETESQPKPQAKEEKRKASIFASDSSDDDLFSSKSDKTPKANTSQLKSVSETPKETKPTFSDPLSTPVTETPKASFETLVVGSEDAKVLPKVTTSKTETASTAQPEVKNLFDESSEGSSDELFGKKAKPPASKLPSKVIPTKAKSVEQAEAPSQTRKPPKPSTLSLFDDSDDSDDLFKKK